MENNKTCPICGKALDASRLAQYPSAVACGPECGVEHRRVQINRMRKSYLTRRRASDPAFVLLEKQKARRRYVSGRLRLGKTPAERAPMASTYGPGEGKTPEKRMGFAVGLLWACNLDSGALAAATGARRVRILAGSCDPARPRAGNES